MEPARHLGRVMGLIYFTCETEAVTNSILSNSSSNLNISRLPLVKFQFDTLFHVKFANQSSFAPIHISSLWDLH